MAIVLLLLLATQLADTGLVGLPLLLSPHLLYSLHLEPVPGRGSGNLWRRRNLWSLPVQQPLLNRPPSRAFFQGAEELPPEKSVSTLEGSGSAADEAGSPRPVQAASFSLLKMEGLPVPLLCLPPPVEGHPARQTGGRAGRRWRQG